MSEYLSTEEAAELLRTNPVTLRESRVSGQLWGRPSPVFRKLGNRKVLYSKQDLIQWIEAVPLRRHVGGEV